jgi:hypothetical protein
VVVVAALVGFVVWLLLIRDGGSAPGAGEGPVTVSEADLAALADELGYPVYWAGEQDGAELEATRTQNGQVYVRYLTDDAQAGDPRNAFLTVGTYPFEDAIAELERLGDEKGALINETPDGGMVVTNESSASSVYIAYPDQNLQIEVFDPDPATAFTLATEGAIVPVD